MTSLKRSLGLFSLVLYATGMILGAGIYSVIGKASGLVGTSLWLSFLLAAVCAGLTALSYAELATFKPKAGAEYIYLRSAFPKMEWLSALVGLVMAFSGIATAAAVAVAFGGYLGDFIPWPGWIAALVLLLLATMVNSVGIEESTKANMIFTFIEIGGLLLFILIGFNPGKAAVTFSAPISPQVLTGTALVIFAYFGFENIVNLVEETKDPGKTLPRAILISLVISAILYVLVSVSATALASPEVMAASNAPLMDAVKKSAPNAVWVLGVCALFSTGNTVLIAMLTASRAFYGMAKHGSFPRLFGRVSKKKAPWRASLLVLFLSLLLLPFGEVETMASVSSFVTLIGFCAVNLTLIRLRFTEPDEERPFRVPLSVGKTPIFPVLGVMSSVILMGQFGAKVYVLSVVCVGILMGLTWWHLSRRPSA